MNSSSFENTFLPVTLMNSLQSTTFFFEPSPFLFSAFLFYPSFSWFYIKSLNSLL